MMNIEMDIGDMVRGLRAVALATGGDEFPDMLIELVDGRLHFVATDGKWMVEWRRDVDLQGCARVGVCGRSLNALIPSLTRFDQPGAASLGELQLGEGAAYVEDGVESVRVEHATLGAVILNGAALSEIPFADKYESMMRPKCYPEPDQYFAGTSEHLSKVADAFRIVGESGRVALVLRAGGANDPLHVTSPSVPELTVILMPVALDERIPKP